MKTKQYKINKTQTLENVHDESVCAGTFCAIHNPSDHHMKDWPLYWRQDKAQLERICPHGAGHPDPDDLAWHIANGRGYMGIHGCHLNEDTGWGCCLKVEVDYEV
jgi:hypothetical protein